MRGLLRRLWAECPRADWLLAIASRAGLPLERLIRATRDLDVSLPATDWASADRLLADLGAALDQPVELEPARIAKVEELSQQHAGPSGDDGVGYAIAAIVDAGFELHQRRHADVVRAAIPYRDVRAALYGQPASSPYR